MQKKMLYLLSAVILFGLLFFMVLPCLDVVLFGIFIYYLARPAYSSLTCILRSETIRAAISLFLLILPLILLFVYLASIASVELENIFMPGTQASIALNENILALSELSKKISYEEIVSILGKNKSLEDVLLSTVSGSLILFLKIFLVIIIAYYLLKDGKKLRSWAINSFLDGDSEIVKKFLDKTDSNFHQFFMGNILAAVITAIFGSIVFVALDYFLLPPELSIGKYAILLGVLCGVANLIPAVGMNIIMVPLSIYFVIQAQALGILLEAWWVILLSIAIIIVIVDWIPDLLVRPYISGKNIHPGLMLLSYTFGAWTFGITGLLLGPMVVILAVNLCQILPEVRKKWHLQLISEK